MRPSPTVKAFSPALVSTTRCFIRLAVHRGPCSACPYQGLPWQSQAWLLRHGRGPMLSTAMNQLSIVFCVGHKGDSHAHQVPGQAHLAIHVETGGYHAANTKRFSIHWQSWFGVLRRHDAHPARYGSRRPWWGGSWRCCRVLQRQCGAWRLAWCGRRGWGRLSLQPVATVTLIPMQKVQEQTQQYSV